MYPASFIPDFTTASAMPLIMSSLTLQPNLFQEFHPMGGVRARFAETVVCSWANDTETRNEATRQNAKVKRLIFMGNVVPEDAVGGYGFGWSARADSLRMIAPEWNWKADVILNGGEAGVRDRTRVRSAPDVDGIHTRACIIGGPFDYIDNAQRRTVPRRALRPPQDDRCSVEIRFTMLPEMRTQFL